MNIVENDYIGGSLQKVLAEFINKNKDVIAAVK